MEKDIYKRHVLGDKKYENAYPYYFFGDFPENHNHDYWEFLLVLQGSYHHTLNKKTELLSRYTALLLQPNTDYHHFRNAESATKHLAIRIRVPLMQQICANFSEDFYDNLVTQRKHRVFFNDAQVQKIINYVSLIRNEASAKSADLFINFLITYILEKVFSQNNFFNSSKPQWLTDLLLKINEPNNMHWSVTDAVKNTAFSHPHLLRLFKEYEHCTLIEYMTKIKMEQACHFLIYSNMSIVSIAQTLGYSESSHFNRIFKKTYRITPSEYKKQNLHTKP
ncbi:MAG: helix-turn-helix transcriptional regulator [Clostridia bacterium]|nr:helix-turn-helix transcriptional regulator [Clostridia bacterium]